MVVLFCWIGGKWAWIYHIIFRVYVVTPAISFILVVSVDTNQSVLYSQCCQLTDTITVFINVSFLLLTQRPLNVQVIYAILKSSWISLQVGVLRICILKTCCRIYHFIVQIVTILHLLKFSRYLSLQLIKSVCSSWK